MTKKEKIKLIREIEKKYTIEDGLEHLQQDCMFVGYDFTDKTYNFLISDISESYIISFELKNKKLIRI